jgi:16S rRNA U1498 N3-methylase RsmE
MHEVGIERDSLGAHIMRIETAAVVGAAMLGALFE